MKLAYFSPLNPQPSGISDYSEELLPYLARHGEVHIFIDDYQPSNQELLTRFPVFNHREFARRWEEHRYDMVIYQMGNSPYHRYIYPYLLDYPGVVVLHDYIIHHLVAGMTLGQGHGAAYVREMAYDGGRKGIAVAREVLAGRRPPPFFDFPLVRRVVDVSLGVIVHSRYVYDLVRDPGPVHQRRIALVPMGVPVLILPGKDEGPAAEPGVSRGALRAELGLEKEVFLVASFGEASPHKRIDVALRAFARFHRQFPRSLFLVVGNVVPIFDVYKVARSLGVEEAVKVTGYVDRETFHRYLHAADVCVQLRYPTAGETSATVLRAMAAGKPVIVSNVGAAQELPDEACIKVDVDDTEEEFLFRSLVLLEERGELRHQLGEKARQYVLEHHTLLGAAEGYVHFVSQLLASASREQGGQDPVEDEMLLEGLAQELARMGAKGQDARVIRRVGRAAADIGLFM